MVVTDEERDWVVASLKGDHEAFKLLVQQHQRMIHSLCYRMTGSLAEAEDLAQETFVTAFQQLESFRSEARFSSWLYRIGTNLCLNWRKRSERRERLHRAWAEEERSPAEPEGGQAERVQDALMKLAPKQRAAIVLTCFEGMSHAEAARVLGCSETTVSWRVFAARRKLKVLLGSSKEPEGGA